MSRRRFLGALASTLGIGGLTRSATAVSPDGWDRGRLRHLLPTVSASEILIKASFDAPLAAAPVLRIDALSVPGVMSDTGGEMWAFHAGGLEAGRRYRLSLLDGKGAALCEPWELATFPPAGARPERVRVLLYTCAGGHDRFGYLPTELRNRLLRRGLSFAPDAVVANGDHVYWDLRSPRTSSGQGRSPLGISLAGEPDRSAPVLGTANERFPKAAAGPQIAPVYGTDFRSTPVFFIQDDHDYFENDEAGPRLVTFPPDPFMSALARTTQRLYYPELLTDPGLPRDLPGVGVDSAGLSISESFGALRYGRLLEMLLYTGRRTVTLDGPEAVFLDHAVEDWLMARMADEAVDHLVHAPSTPPGWSAGKWGEWYPDRRGADGALSLDAPKPYWQEGWARQHDRLMSAMSAMPGRVPLVLSGDLHATALGRIRRTGAFDLSANPVIAALCGTIGTGEAGWPSHSRGTPPRPSLHLEMDELVAPIEQHGFTLADFTPEKAALLFFKWDRKTQSPEAIDSLEPFHEIELPRPD